MTRLISALLLMVFLAVFVPGDQAFAKKKKKKVRKYFRYVRKAYPLYHKMFVAPEIQYDEDAVKIEQTLKEQGIPYIKYNGEKKCFIIQYGANSMTAIDIMQALKNLGYTVSSID